MTNGTAVAGGEDRVVFAVGDLVGVFGRPDRTAYVIGVFRRVDGTVRYTVETSDGQVLVIRDSDANWWLETGDRDE